MEHESPSRPKPLQVVPITPPAPEVQARRGARFAASGEKPTRYTLPAELRSGSPVGYRTRVPLTQEESRQAMELLSLQRPKRFVPGPAVTEQELFEECSLGVLSARQSTNYRGHRQVTFGPGDSERIMHLLRSLRHRDAEVLEGASHTHIVLSRPYRTPFTFLLTFIGHKPLLNLATVPIRALRKRFQHVDDIPTIGYLQHLHLGILADAMERAAVIASSGARRAQVHMAPFCSEARRADNAPMLNALEELCGLSARDRMEGWRVALVAQVGSAPAEEVLELPRPLARKVGANLMAFRSERILPGENAEERAPAVYQQPQGMDVPDELTVQAGRAGYNAFAHWTGGDRERAKHLLMLERIDALTPAGKARLSEVREKLDEVADRVIANLPLWADLPTGRRLSSNTARGKKAFALTGQRIYLGGLSRAEVEAEGLEWELAVRAVGAASARSALFCELMGVTELPEGCDLLAGVCMMAGPVNQNDVGKQFYGHADLLASRFPGRDVATLLVWTLKAKTVADPIGNEEQLMNPQRKGALVELRPAPHEVIQLRRAGRLEPMRLRDGKTNEERAFWDVCNFVTDPEGQEIPGNRGLAWPERWSREAAWPSAD